jgi:hypothetical protein
LSRIWSWIRSWNWSCRWLGWRRSKTYWKKY